MLIPFGCNKTAETELPTPQKTERSTRGNKSTTILGTTVHDFIRSFYSGASYTIGRQIETTDNGTIYLVSEVVVSSARGYIVTNQVGSTPLYFADVDRTNFVLTSVDITNNETVTAQDINLLPEYALTNDFDFIEVVKIREGEVPTPEGLELQRRPFWGWGKWDYFSDCKPCNDPDLCGTGNVRWAARKYYIFGIGVDTEWGFRPC